MRTSGQGSLAKRSLKGGHAARLTAAGADRRLPDAHVRIVQGIVDLRRKLRRIFEHAERLRTETRIGIGRQILRKSSAQRGVLSRQLGAR